MANDVSPVVGGVLDVFSDPKNFEYKFPYPRNRDGSGGVAPHARAGGVKMPDLECPHCKGSGRVIAETMGQRVKAIRLLRGLKTSDVVRLTNKAISQGSLNHLEAGRNRNIRVEALEAVAVALQVDAGYLLTGKGEP